MTIFIAELVQYQLWYKSVLLVYLAFENIERDLCFMFKKNYTMTLDRDV